MSDLAANADTACLNIVVLGASGDLARRKIFPALFALHCQGFLPKGFQVFGFARSQMDDAAFRERITENLTCRYAPGESCADLMDEFLAACRYVPGDYGDADAYRNLAVQMSLRDAGGQCNRLFYFAIPPSVFLDAARALGQAGLIHPDNGDHWTRVVIEKPFGRDRASSDILTGELGKVFTERQTYRIDHYLGKEVIQNLLVLRFANLIFEPIWRREYIRRVDISWTEDLDIAGRGGYFDQYGIIRDVMQNHLIQMLSLVAMEPPGLLQARDIQDEKVKVLRCITPVSLDSMVIGQYVGSELDGQYHPGYTEDESVPSDSLTDTFAAAVLRIRNARWDGVPFFVRAGKGMGGSCTEIQIHFEDMPGNMFRDAIGHPEMNKLVIRVQPDEAVHFEITSKVPGLNMDLARQKLDLQYKSTFAGEIPDAYESLLIDVLRGDKSLFIRRDELAAAWDIFSPMLHEVEAKGLKPDPYPFGSNGPEAAREMFWEQSGATYSDEQARRHGMSDTCDQEGHKGHLCILASRKEFEKLQELVKDPKFVCFNCGRVAHDESSLCNPMPLKD